MTIFIGIILFIIGTLGAFTTAAAGIAYLKISTIYSSLNRLYRAMFKTGMITIAMLISVLIAQMAFSGIDVNIAEDVLAAPATEFSMETEEAAEIEEQENKNTEVITMQEVATDDTSEENIAPEENTVVPEANVAPEQPASQPTITQPTETRSSIIPSFTAWSNIYKGHEYAYIEIEGGVPYVYAPNHRGSFWYDLNNISSGRESSNIVVMANAGLFDTTSLAPLGTTIQNGKVVSSVTSNYSIPRILVVDDSGNVGYTTNSAGGVINSYIDAVTGETVTGRKIISAVYGFGPVVLNGKTATKYSGKIANGYRARQVFCVRAKNKYTIITNTGEGENGGGWNFDDIAEVARRRGCVSAFNLDGGGSTALAWRKSLNQGFQAYATTERHDPTFIVFTADNLAPSGK